MNANENIVEVLEALERAKANVPKDWDYLSYDDDVMTEVMEMEYMPKPLSAHLGVEKELFPAVSLLEEDEVKAVVDKILEVWAVYNYYAELPGKLPIRMAYDRLLSVWDDTVACCPVGNLHFCFYDPDLEQYFEEEFKDPHPF